MYGARKLAWLACLSLAVIALGDDAHGQVRLPFPEAPSIGWAWMNHQGTVFLHLSGGRSHGEIGYGDLEIEPFNPHYRELLEHLGGLNPGETKPVAPWRADEKWHCAIDSRRGDCPLSHRLEPSRLWSSDALENWGAKALR